MALILVEKDGKNRVAKEVATDQRTAIMAKSRIWDIDASGAITAGPFGPTNPDPVPVPAAGITNDGTAATDTVAREMATAAGSSAGVLAAVQGMDSGQAATAGTKIVEAPAILRGTVRGSAGVTLGVVDGAMRIANGTALQANITAANTNGKHFELEPGAYEIDRAAGIVIPETWGGRSWRGTKQSIIRQFAANAPILTLGDFAGGGAAAMDVQGFALEYGTAQAGNTLANALVIGSLAWSRIGDARICDVGQRPYRAIYVPSPSPFGLFSNSFEDIMACQGQQNCVRIERGGTGNRWENLYMAVGNATAGPAVSAGPVFHIAADPVRGGGVYDESTFGQVNIEWAKAPQAMHFELARGLKFDSVHIEYFTANGYAASVFWLSLSHVKIDSLMMRSPQFLTAQGASGPLAFFNGFGHRSAKVDNFDLHLEKHDSGYPVPINTAVVLFGSNNDAVNDPKTHTIDHFNVTGPDAAACMPLLGISDAASNANFGFPTAAQSIRSVNNVVKTDSASINVSAAHTVYAAHDEPTIICPVAPPAAFTVTLSTKRGPAGSGFGNTPPKTGQMAFVVRTGGTANGNAISVNSDGTLIETITTSNTKRGYLFNGTAWVAA